MGAATGVKGIRDACRCVVLAVLMTVVFAASARAAPTSVTEYPVEVGHSTDIDHIAVGADGTVWFADGYWPEGSFHALIGRFDPSDGAVEEFDQGLNHFSVIRDFVAGPDGNMWFADSGSANADAAIGKISRSGRSPSKPAPSGASRGGSSSAPTNRCGTRRRGRSGASPRLARSGHTNFRECSGNSPRALTATSGSPTGVGPTRRSAGSNATATAALRSPSSRPASTRTACPNGSSPPAATSGLPT